MIEWLIDLLFEFNYRENSRGAILAGGWILLAAFLILLLSHELLPYAVFVGIVGAIVFTIGCIFHIIKKNSTTGK